MKNVKKPDKKPTGDTPLRLFVLIDNATGKRVTDDNGQVIYYSDKKTAKAKRSHTQQTGLGPDHRRSAEYLTATPEGARV